MAGLYDKVFIVGTAAISSATNKFYFRARKGFYTGEMATATGVTVATAAADLAAPLTAVKDLLHSKALQTIDVIATLGGVSYRVKVHCAAAQAATVGAALEGQPLPTIAGAKSSGAVVTSVASPLRVTGRS